MEDKRFFSIFLVLFFLFACSSASSQNATSIQAVSQPTSSYGFVIGKKIRSNLIFNSSIDGNPIVEYEINCSSIGVIDRVRLVSGSASELWDRAVLAAIFKTEVLPKDIDGRYYCPFILAFKYEKISVSEYDSEVKKFNNELERRRLKEISDLEKEKLNELTRIYGDVPVGIKLESISPECIHKVDIFTCALYGDKLEIVATVRNNVKKEIIDVNIRCRHFGQSGTELSSFLDKKSVTIFQKWAVDEIRRVKFTISDIDQRNKTVCSVVGWK